MKKTAFGILVLILFGAVLGAFIEIMHQKTKINGLEKELIDTIANDPNLIVIPLSDNIIKPDIKWVQKYGDDLDSRLVYNVAVIINSLKQQIKAIKDLQDPNNGVVK